MDEVPPSENENTPLGFALGLSVYVAWGLLPFYFKASGHLPSLEVLANRVVWSIPIAGIALLLLRRVEDLKAALRNPRTLAMACVTAMLISVNWGVYVWAVANGMTLQTALGYFINPLFSIFLASVVLKERLAPAQICAIGLAAIAVVILTVDAGGLPWIAIALTVSWGGYAFLRKTLPIGPSQGFFLEVLIISILALPYVIYLEATGQGHLFDPTGRDTLLLVASGVITAIPLMIYARAAKLLKLSTIGIMQYIVPTLVFLIAVFVFHEPLDMVKLSAFTLIWMGLAIFTWSIFRQNHPRQPRS